MYSLEVQNPRMNRSEWCGDVMDMGMAFGGREVAAYRFSIESMQVGLRRAREVGCEC